MKISGKNKVIFLLSGLILILVGYIIFILSTSRDFQTEIDTLKEGISERNNTIETLTFDIEDLNIVDGIRKQNNQNIQKSLDSVIKIKNEIRDPKNDPIPEPNARDSAIIKMSSRFQRTGER